MANHIIKQIPNFPYKEHILEGAALVLDAIESVFPSRAVSVLWKEVKDKADILDDFVKPFSIKHKFLSLKGHIDEWNDAFSKKSLEVACSGSACVKRGLGLVKSVDKYAVSFLKPAALRGVKVSAKGVDVVSDAALLGMRAHELYEKRDTDLTGENALIKASSRFVSSIYELIASTLLLLSLFMEIPFFFLVLTVLYTSMFLTNIFADVYVKF